jgi:predicted RNA-binding Zn ribbon-like protein
MEQRTLDEAIDRLRGFDLDGGQLALDFTNTLEWRNTEKEYEWLEQYGDLLGWGVRVEFLTAESAKALWLKAERRAQQAADTLVCARELRESLFRVFYAVIAGQPPADRDWRHLNREVQAAMSTAAIGVRNESYLWSFPDAARRLDFFRGPVIKAAADLLIDGDHSRLKRCSTPDCQWLFVDTSKNRSRRWCDMQSCGNRAKARRYYRKTREARVDTIRVDVNTDGRHGEREISAQ